MYTYTHDSMGYSSRLAASRRSLPGMRSSVRGTVCREFKDVVFEDVVFDDNRFGTDVAIKHNR